ncbi:hypothetical protein ACYZT2_18480 [Pseudomonas sp. MDT1-85]
MDFESAPHANVGFFVKNKIVVDEGISSDVVLWRYMSLEKFIHLLDTCTLFLSPIAFFKNSDPLEGHLPRKFHEMIESHFRSARQDSALDRDGVPEELSGWMKEWSLISDNRLRLMREKTRGRQSICCWYESQFESEAMWKLYGDNHFGIW